MQKGQLSGQIKVFYSDAYKIGMAATEGGLKKTPLLKAVEQIYLYIDRVIESLLAYAKKEGTKIYCRKGCSLCCHQPVYALTHEALFLQDYINDNFSKKETEDIFKKAREKDKLLTGLQPEELQNSKYPCPLLKNGTCMAYTARPMACRIYLSLSFESCRLFYDDPGIESEFPKIMHFPLQAGRMMNEGFKAALKQAGAETREYRVEESLLVDLNYPFI